MGHRARDPAFRYIQGYLREVRSISESHPPMGYVGDTGVRMVPSYGSPFATLRGRAARLIQWEESTATRQFRTCRRVRRLMRASSVEEGGVKPADDCAERPVAVIRGLPIPCRVAPRLDSSRGDGKGGRP